MKTITEFLGYVLVIGAFLGASTVVAQRAAGTERNYDPATVETVHGKVTAIEHPTTNRRGGRGMGVHLTLRVEKETISIHLGPYWFMKKQALQVETGDEITVTGSRVTLEGKPALIAAEIKKADKTLRLRDASGIPVWAGRGGQNR